VSSRIAVMNRVVTRDVSATIVAQYRAEHALE
jgi:hypothetical protein